MPSKQFIYPIMFSAPEISVGSTRWNSFTKIQTWDDAVVLKFGEPLPGLLSFGSMCGDQTFNGLICTWARSPIGVMFSDSRDGISCV
jgi:hypothetical protein